MSPEESEWWGSRLAEHEPHQISPIVNLGSSTRAYREEACPFIHANLFRPLEQRGVEVIHVDAKAAEGVDIVGDITTPEVQAQIRSRRPRAVLCTNLLEHVSDRRRVCAAIERLLPEGGLALVSVPYRYPYHPDPIDTGFRPSADELRTAFGSNFALARHETVAFGNYLGQIRAKPWLVVRDAYLLAGGFAKPDRWRVFFGNYSHLLRPYQVTCAVLSLQRGPMVSA